MALQLGRRIGRHVCANKFHLYARSYTSGPPVSPIASSTSSSSLLSVPAFTTVVGTAGYCFTVGWFFWNDFAGIGKRYAEWMGENKRLEMLATLDREKYKSDDAYLQALERELDAMKAKLLSRELNSSRVKIFERDMAGLEAKICEWTDKDKYPGEVHSAKPAE